jgi:hypothetical protein
MAQDLFAWWVAEFALSRKGCAENAERPTAQA